MMFNFCDRVDPFVKDEELLWRAEKQLIRNGKRITAFEIGKTPTKAKVKLYNLLTALMFCFFGFAQQETECWYIYESTQKIDLMKNDKYHAIKHKTILYVDKIEPGEHTIVFADQDKAPSYLNISNCPKSVTLNIYNGEGKLKTYGGCHINYLTQ